jgi:hypothetical protein
MCCVFSKIVLVSFETSTLSRASGPGLLVCDNTKDVSSEHLRAPVISSKTTTKLTLMLLPQLRAPFSSFQLHPRLSTNPPRSLLAAKASHCACPSLCYCPVKDCRDQGGSGYSGNRTTSTRLRPILFRPSYGSVAPRTKT